MSAPIFARTALQLLVAVSLADWMSRFTFSAAAVAAARACSLRATTLSRVSFFAAAKASSACFARTDNSASCSESGLGMGFTPITAWISPHFSKLMISTLARCNYDAYSDESLVGERSGSRREVKAEKYLGKLVPDLSRNGERRPSVRAGQDLEMSPN